MNFLNKTFKRINSTGDDTFFTSNIDGEFVVFSNGARCKISTLLSEFEEITTMSINEELEANPDTFFEPKTTLDPSLANQLQSLEQNPGAVQNSGRMNQSTSLDDDDNNRYEKISPGGNKQPQSNGLASRLDSNETNSNSDSIKPNINANRPAEFDVYDNVKLSDEIEISVPFKIKLPRADKIDVLNDMFKTSFTGYLAKKYIQDNVINNSIKLQGLIQKGIEDWMEEELSNYKPKRKKLSKAEIKKQEKIKDNTPTEIVTASAVVTDKDANINNFFNKNVVSNWDGNLKKLFLISNEEQYNAVKKTFVSLKDSNINLSEADRLEDMLLIYEEQFK